MLSQFKYFNFVCNHFLENSVEDEKMLSAKIGAFVSLMARLHSHGSEKVIESLDDSKFRHLDE